MTHKKNTKKALTASIISLLLCISMLIGSTFAWFTDTATTGVNTIVSGNLDIALYKGEVSGGAVSYGSEVTNETKLFNDAALWEPGYTEVAYLKIENKGNLALKYRLNIDVVNEIIGKTVGGANIKLSEILKYDVIDIGESDCYADREEALAAVGTGKNLVSETVFGSMNPKDTRYLALVIYMPTTVGNEANNNGTEVPAIQLGVNIVATQETVESDSFDHLYDIDADPLAVTGKVVSGEDTIIETSKSKAVIPADATAEGAVDHRLTIEEKDDYESNIAITGSGLTYDVNITNIAGNNTEVITVSWFIGTGIDTIGLYHDTVAMTKLAELPTENFTADTYYYDAETGYLTVYVTHFSEFIIDLTNEGRIGTVYYSSFEDTLAAAGADDTIVLTNDVELDATVTLEGKDITIDGDGHVVSGKGIQQVATSSGYEIVGFKINDGNVTLQNMILTGFDLNPACNRGSVISVGLEKPADFTARGLIIDKFARDAFSIYSGTFVIENCRIDCEPDESRTTVLTKGFQIGSAKNAFDVSGKIINTFITNSDSTYEAWQAAAIEMYAGATVEINGCHITNSVNGIYIDNYWAGKSSFPNGDVTVTIKNTNVECVGSLPMPVRIDSRETQSGSKVVVNIESGKFIGYTGLILDQEKGQWMNPTQYAKYSITGGIYSYIEETSIAAGYTSITNDDGTYSVVASN